MNVDDASDLIGEVGSNPTEGTNNADNNSGGGALAAVNAGVSAANKKDDQKQRDTEEKLVKRYLGEYKTGRAFDKSWLAGMSKDRQYASGMADPRWASDANMIGTFIDILVSFLYAQNPDVGARAARKVEEQPDKTATDLAETMELVVSKLWMMSGAGQGQGLKSAVRAQVRSTLTCGEGWIKAVMWSKQRPQPQVEKRLHDMEAQVLYINRLKEEATEDQRTEYDVTLNMITYAITGLRAKVMLQKEFGLNVDFVRAENIQCSLDVASTQEYLGGDWMSEDLYIPIDSLRERFTRLDAEDQRAATVYYQRNVPANALDPAIAAATGEEVYAGQYTKTEPSNATSGSDADKPVKFCKVIEFWDRRDGMIKTMVEGVKRWAVEPYPPNQATLRFYPYFRLAFYEVDGQRHPQSLSFRMRKLQDEYSACRSNQRLTRERSIPGLIFHKGQVSQEEARRLEGSVIAEMVGVDLTDPNFPIQNAIMDKKLPVYNPALYDSTPIISDMERISGVQEAMQQALTQQPKTATEAQIQQSGFASRTGADRDTLEEMLTDLASYTEQCAIQEIDFTWVQRVAGAQAFWPQGMDVQDLLHMVEVEIAAGTTGKPNSALDKQNWATILPLLQKLMVQIRQVEMTDPPLAEALENMLKESLRRMDDRLDIEQFIPTTPPPPQPPPLPPPPSVNISLKGELPPLDAAAIGAKAAGLPPEAALAAGGAPSQAHAHAGIPPHIGHPDAGDEPGEMPLMPGMPAPLPSPKPPIGSHPK